MYDSLMNQDIYSTDLNSQSLSIELASGPKEERTHPDTTGEMLDNLLRNILSSKVTE